MDTDRSKYGLDIAMEYVNQMLISCQLFIVKREVITTWSSWYCYSNGTCCKNKFYLKYNLRCIKVSWLGL